MASSTKRFPPNEWLQRKSIIRDMYLTEKRSLNDIVQALSCDDFHPNKHQLEHKLKLWGFTKNVPKALAEGTWRYIGYEIANRRARSENTEVVLFGQVQDKRKVEAETRRYYRFRYGGEPAPTPPKGVDILLRTPSCGQSIPWPPSLPWLQFQSKYISSLPLRIPSISSLQLHGDLVVNPMLTLISSTIHLTIQPSVPLSGPYLASMLKSTMPELYPGEAADRANIIIRGWSKQALEEQIMILLYHLSSKAFIREFEFELMIDIMEYSGIMLAAIIVSESPNTVLAVREMLFQLAFEAVLEPRFYKIVDIDVSMPRIIKLIKWLLMSGQHPDIAIYFYPSHATPLQIAAWKCSNELLITLLENGANPNLIPSELDGLEWSGIYRFKNYVEVIWEMPPLFLAAYSAHQPDDLSALDILLSSGATIDHYLLLHYGFISRLDFLTILVGKKHEDVALDAVEMLATRPVGIAYLEVTKSNAADVTISAASRGNLKILEFLRDNGFDVIKENEFGLTGLHAAACGGHVKCCEFLLKCGSSPDHHNFAFPSPVHLACYQNHIETVKFLHEKGANIDRELSTPLKLYDIVLARYFCRTFRHPWEIAALFAKIQSPIRAALCEEGTLPKGFQLPFTSRVGGSLAPLVSYLLHHGVAIPAYVISHAASLGDTELLSVALAAGANPNFLEPNGKTPLLLALSVQRRWDGQSELENRAKIGKILLSAGAKATKLDAIRAMRLGDWDLVKEILSHKLLDLPKSPNSPDNETNLLEEALLTGDLCIIQQVLKIDSTSYSPGALCAATLQVVNGVIDLDIVYQLLQHRSPDSIPSKYLMTQETTAVGIAACYESSRILDLLLAHLPVFNTAYFPPNSIRDISVLRPEGRLPIKEAIKNCDMCFWRWGAERFSVFAYALESNTGSMSKLLNHGYRFDWMMVADIVYLRKEEWYKKITPDQPIVSHDEAEPGIALGVLVRYGDIAQVQSLLQVCKAAEGIKLRSGHRNGPLQVATEIGNSEIFDTLLEAGIDPNAPAEEHAGMTALQATAIYNRIGLAKRLIDLKVDVNAPGATFSGRTALEGAAEHGHIDLIKLLLHSGVETEGAGQRQYLRAIGFALSYGHLVAADMLKLHRKLTEEDLSILDEKYLLREIPGSAVSSLDGTSSDSEGEDEGKETDGNLDWDGDKDEMNLAYIRAKAVDDDPTTAHTEDTILGQEGNHQIHQTGWDQTLLFYDDESNEHGLDCFSEDIQLRQEPSSVLDITAPSEGIYNFDDPLLGVHDMGDSIGESP
ncbi:ankyrin repeat-containing domain protein [Xylaria digitata]|nr:ankyrin repeat-containing domain protein [Xylaria digitata]